MTAIHERNRPAPESDAGDATLRQPPQDLHAEQSVLGGMLLSKDAIADVLERLRPDDFYRPVHQNIFDAILDLYGRGEPADAVTVAAELDRRNLLRRVGGAPYLHTLISIVPTAANAGYYAGIVAEKAILRRLVQAGTRVVQYGYAGAEGAEVADVVDRAQAEIYDVTNHVNSEDTVALYDLLQPTMDEIDAIASGGGLARGVPTGFTDIDHITNGLHPGQMIVVAARPGVGKALALETPLPTPTGWTTMGDVQVGQELLGADGRPTRVVAVTEVMVGRPCFDVEFRDGTTITADALHQWPTTHGIVHTEQLREGAVMVQARAVELAAAAEVPEAGDVARWITGADTPSIPEDALRRYLRGSLAQRRALVRAVDAELRRQLAGSGRIGVGEWPRWRDQTCREAFFEVRRTLGWVPGDGGGAAGARVGRAHVVAGVRPRPSVPVRCVQVDNSDHLYLAGVGMVPTHNSTLGLDFLRSCSIRHGQSSVMFSLEMSKSEIVMRLLSAEAKIKLADLRSGRLSDENWAALARCMGRISDAPLYIDDSPNLTMMEIRAKARRLAQRQNLKLIVIDYLQLMTSGKRFESRQQEVSELSRNIKLLAKELEVPVVALSQLNRGPEQRTDKRPILSDLRESGSIEQDSDMVMLLHRPDLVDFNDPRSGEIEVHLAKHRNGPTRKFNLAAQLHFSRIVDMAPEHQQHHVGSQF
ncbi:MULTISPECIES: replicative DNA helicase [Mycolicibacter]|uniref:Replicative DNA helicase n=1 Tax=Mycolicibacter longobardus TaxID=1108812 RepID=A0A1X1YAD6_9MYCO|nr:MULTISPECIES: replicative DNA helicase [Mycolicibacter]ORW08026.1 replicative DNA helicase [Mycolicibacter longobardus]RAV04322.1 replicative DNA helicase [Mycolicibacter senuensis]